MTDMKIHLIHDYAGEWCQLWVNDTLKKEGHSPRTCWFTELFQEMGISVTQEEKCLDSSHSRCDCPKRNVVLVDMSDYNDMCDMFGGDKSPAEYAVYDEKREKHLGYVSSEYYGSIEFDTEGKPMNETILIHVMKVK